MPRAKTVLSLAAASLLLATSALATTVGPGTADKKNPKEAAGWAMVLDFALARPLSLVATVVGTAVFVAALPFEVLSEDVSTPAHVLIVEPAAYTFTRPLGVFH